MRFFGASLAIVAVAAFSCGIIAAAPTLGAVTADELVSNQTVLLEDATAATVELKLDAGDLWLAGGSMAAGRIVGSSELLRADFVHEDGQEPDIDYEVAEGDRTGHLVISSPSPSWSWSASEQEWRLFLNPTVPTGLAVELGTGNAELVVGGMLLSGLEIEAGAGKLTLDLTGDWRTSLAGTIAIGAGDVIIRAPRDTGVKIIVEQGFGTVRGDGFTVVNGAYVNEAYGATASGIELLIEQGAGYLELSED